MSHPSRFGAGPRPSLALGCGVVGLAAASLLLFGLCAVRYLESGANRGRVTLETYDRYPVGAFEYRPAEHFFLVRLDASTFIALSDLDAANRSATGRRCRVAPLATDDAALPALLERYRARMNPALRGSTVLLREGCFGAVYDASGLRLDRDGRNLDRHPVTVDEEGRVVVDTSRRSCSERSGDELFLPVSCRE